MKLYKKMMSKGSLEPVKDDNNNIIAYNYYHYGTQINCIINTKWLSHALLLINDNDYHQNLLYENDGEIGICDYDKNIWESGIWEDGFLGKSIFEKCYNHER